MQSPGQVRVITWRISVWYACLVLVLSIFILRLFYIQIIEHEQYKQAANNSQFKEREVPAERGVIVAKNGEQTVPLVLNEKKYTIFADPVYISRPDEVVDILQPIIGGEKSDIKNKLTADSRYQILAKKMDTSIRDKIRDLKIKGVGAREETHRTYPQGTLAAQLLGFVNDEGQGKYGVEQALDEQLRGKPGELKAITDAAGIPLVANRDNIEIEPQAGGRVELTIDLGMQQRLEELLKEGLDEAKSEAGSLVIIDPNTGAIKAMANYPTYSPAEFSRVEDATVFNNNVVSEPFEVGSIMKPLTIAAALDQGVVTSDWSYSENGSITIDGATISNVSQNRGRISLEDVLLYSLNTGATRVFAQMGGGEINEQARKNWYEYLTNHYQFGKLTGVEQGYEAPGSVASPTDGFGLNIQYANMSFGQGMNNTLLQVAAAFSSIVNGGTYYKPRLVSSITYNENHAERIEQKQPEIVRANVISPDASSVIVGMTQRILERANKSAVRAGYVVGGKTGTAQIARPEGGYYEEKINGTYLGFVGGDSPQYVIAVLAKEPNIPGLAGSRAAAPIFSKISNMLIDSFGVTPKTH